MQLCNPSRVKDLFQQVKHLQFFTFADEAKKGFRKWLAYLEIYISVEGYWEYTCSADYLERSNLLQEL